MHPTLAAASSTGNRSAFPLRALPRALRSPAAAPAAHLSNTSCSSSSSSSTPRVPAPVRAPFAAHLPSSRRRACTAAAATTLFTAAADSFDSAADSSTAAAADSSEGRSQSIQMARPTAAAAPARPQGYYRWPALHADVLVFVCEDDLYSVPVAGGRPHRLTDAPGNVRRPVISPDGTSVAFTVQEDGCQAGAYTRSLLSST